MDGVIVIKRKLRRATKSGADVAADNKYMDPSHESEKPPNPLDFRRTSFAKAFRTKPIWTETRLTSRHIRQLFGEPTRICQNEIEYVLQIPSREILKIVVSSRGAVSICGFQRTATLEKWVERLFNS
jgi:hypothetical protein